MSHTSKKLKTQRIYLSSPHMSEEGYEQDYVKEAFDTNWIAPLGKNVDEFERELAEMVGSKAAVALSSGTAAIHLALKNLGVGKGDVVFCQTLTFVASANPILYRGATPVFIDSERETGNLDPDLLEEAFQRYQPKAVIAVHLYGLSCQIDRIRDICDRHNTPLIEDAAESLGTLYKGQWTGTFGDYGIFSFNGNKIITTSGGGMLVSNNERGIRHARFLATQAREQARHYEHKEVGHNYRMSNVVAGIGRGQLKVLDQRVEQKRHIYDLYKEGFEDIPEIEVIPDHEYEYSNHWLTVIQIHSPKVTPSMIVDALEAENIESRPVWKPMHLQPVFADYDFVGGTVAEDLFKNGVCLPSDTKMPDDDVERVVSIIRTMFEA